MEGDFYTVDEAARILKLTPGRVRQMLRAGELEGVSPEASGERGWRIAMRAVHDRERPSRVERSPEPPDSPERLSELEVEVRELRYQLGLSRGRLELQERAESSVREELERERELADWEREGLSKVLDEERAERRRLQEELDRLREEAAQRERDAARPWWRKLFGN